MIRTEVALVAALLGTALAPAAADERPATEDVQLPITLERVWFRTVRGGAWIRLGNSSGDLTIRPDALAFTTNKKTVELPIERVHSLTYGRIRADVDTEWVLLGVGERRSDTIVAIRDGKKLGYGQRTHEIYETLKRALRSLGAAHYRVPEGFRAFDNFDLVFSLAYPETWDPYIEDVVIVGDRAPFGSVVFSSEPLRHASAEGPVVDEAAVARALGGEVPAFFVERLPAEKGMKCKGFSAKGSQRLLELALEGRLFPHGAGTEATPAAAPEMIDFCNGLRLSGRARAEAGATGARVELHAAASNGTLFVFGMRARPEVWEQTRAVLAQVLETVRFSVSE